MHVVRQETRSENERGNSGAHVTTDGMAEKYVFPPSYKGAKHSYSTQYDSFIK